MTTPVHITGFECGCNPTTNGLGLWNSVNGSPVVDSTIKRTGAYSLKIVAPGAGQAYNCRKNIGASVQTAVATFHFYVPTGGTPSANTIISGFTFGTYSGTAGLHLTSAGTVRAQVGSGTTVGSTTLVLDQWHRVDLKLVITSSTWTMNWYLDGVAQTDATMTGQPTNDSIAGFRFGSSSTTATYTIYFDDCVLSETGADFPIGDVAVEALLPSSDGTHNADPSGILTDQAGNDITSVSVYDKINSVPTNGTQYIKQQLIGVSNYAEILFGDIVASHTSILGAIALLAYSSETTTSNRGACMVSKDGFSSNTAVWGAQGSTQDYSDGTPSAPFWKSAMVAGANTTSLVNSLSARIGYSDDATPDPYWIDLIVEVAYVPSGGDINLDLVSYSNTFNDITLLENEIIPLDLVSYSSTFNDVTLVENIPIDLDLVTYSSSFNDITVLENVVESLDLVSYSSSVNDLVLLENEIVPLDLVTYSSTFNDLTVLENEIVPLDLVSYSNLYDDIVVVENEIVHLDLVSYTGIINDIDLIENELVPLDLVSYSIIFDDIDLLEEGEIALDLVEFALVIYDLDLVGDEITDLDLVSYSIVVNDVDFYEQGVEMLDLVTYSSVFNPVTFETESENVSVVLERVYAINKQNRVLSVDIQNRTFTIDRQDRTF